MSLPKKRTAFRILSVCCCTVIGVLLLAAVAAGVKYAQLAKKSPEVIVTEKPEFVPAEKALLGEEVRCGIQLRAPWGSTPEPPSVTPPEGMQLAAEPVCEAAGYRWGYTVWDIAFLFQPYRTGKMTGGSVRFGVRTPDGEVTMFEFPLPELETELREFENKSPELDIADQTIAIPEKGSYVQALLLGIIGLILVGSVIFILVRLFRRQQKAQVKSVWDITLESIRNLRSLVTDGRESAEHGMGTLTDIVRRFLEKRYALRAERQTTAEFLRELDRADSPLPDSARRFLRHFLESADMVKFAKMSADIQAFENAALHAEELVNTSRTEEKKG